MTFPLDTRSRFYVGLAGIRVSPQEIDVGCGAILRSTFAHLMAPFVLAFKPPLTGGPHPGPWKNVSGGLALDISGEIEIPRMADTPLSDRLNLARVIVALIRLTAHPQTMAPIVSTTAFAAAADARDNTAYFMPFEVQERHMALTSPVDGALSQESLKWLQTAVPKTVVLMDQHPELDVAVVALDRCQFVREPALILISLWAALEAIFSPDKSSELKFRIAARIACYLEPAGTTRLELYNRVRKLYDARSAAAHGSPKRKPELALVETYNLLRRIVIQIIERNHLPTQPELETAMFA